jgi:hypothetical protein
MICHSARSRGICRSPAVPSLLLPHFSRPLPGSGNELSPNSINKGGTDKDRKPFRSAQSHSSFS